MDRLTRRDFVGSTLLLGGVAALGSSGLAAGCGSSSHELTCMDTSGLAAADLAMRTQLQYADRAPNPAQNCGNCRFFVAGAQAAEQCGTCSLVKGPIHPKGHCISWVAKA